MFRLWDSFIKGRLTSGYNQIKENRLFRVLEYKHYISTNYISIRDGPESKSQIQTPLNFQGFKISGPHSPHAYIGAIALTSLELPLLYTLQRRSILGPVT